MDNINEMENIRNKCVNANSIDLQIHIVMFMRNCINELKNQNDWLASQARKLEGLDKSIGDLFLELEKKEDKI